MIPSLGILLAYPCGTKRLKKSVDCAVNLSIPFNFNCKLFNIKGDFFSK